MNNQAYHMALSQLLQRSTKPKLGLARMDQLVRELRPRLAGMKIIQVVGTNGKGSTVAFIESVLRANGYSTELFTSPHLCTARERILLNGHMVSEDLFVEAAAHINYICAGWPDQPSFFECMLAMALWLCAEAKVEVAILEAGLGGRLDATTATKPDILGLSMIDLDHQHILGDSIEKIATEKIAAARRGQLVVSVQQNPKAAQVLIEAQKKLGFQLDWAPACEQPLGLVGEHQKNNAGLALSLIAGLGLKITEKNTTRGLLEVSWPGRFEIIALEVDIILDGAHNPSGIKALCRAIRQHPNFDSRPVVVVFGSLAGPNTEQKMAELLSSLRPSHLYVHTPHNPRAESAPELRRLFLEQGLAPEGISIFSNWQQVMSHASHLGAYILVCGSLYTVGEARAALLKLPTDAAAPNF